MAVSVLLWMCGLKYFLQLCLNTSLVGEKGYQFGRLLSGFVNRMFWALQSPQPIRKPLGKSMERITGHDIKMARPVERLLIRLRLNKTSQYDNETYKHWVYLIYCTPMKVIRWDIFLKNPCNQSGYWNMLVFSLHSNISNVFHVDILSWK
jgi:hypothetical protein